MFCVFLLEANTGLRAPLEYWHADLYFLDLLFEVPLEYWHADLYVLDLLFEVPLEYWHADVLFRSAF